MGALTQTVGVTVCLGMPAEPKVAPQHKILALPRRGCVKVGQPGATAVGTVFGMSWVARSCQCNGVNALVLRHGAEAPPCRRTFDAYDAAVARFVVEYAALDPEVYDGWLAKWPLSKQEAILKSIRDDRARPNALKTFIKREPGHARPKKGRLIQSYSTLSAQELCAREFRCFQKALGAMFDVNGFELQPGVFVTIGSGLNANDIATWARVAQDRCKVPVYYERDGKNWDSTMQRPHHELKTRFARAVSQRLAEFMDASYSCTGVARFGSGDATTRLVYQLNGTVKSGHNDTSSGNSLINAAISAEVFNRLGLRASVIVAGDDMLAVVDGDFDVDSVIAEEAAYGIVPEANKFYDLNDVSFISACFLSDGEEILFVPVLGRLLLRLWWTTKPPRPQERVDYMFGVASGLHASVRGVALYEDFVAPVLRRGCVDEGVAEAHRLRRWRYSAFGDPTVTTSGFRTALAMRYGITVDELDAFGRFLRELPTEPAFAWHYVADIIIARDCADVVSRPCARVA